MDSLCALRRNSPPRSVFCYLVLLPHLPQSRRVPHHAGLAHLSRLLEPLVADSLGFRVSPCQLRVDCVEG